MNIDDSALDIAAWNEFLTRLEDALRESGGLKIVVGRLPRPSRIASRMARLASGFSEELSPLAKAYLNQPAGKNPSVEEIEAYQERLAKYRKAQQFVPPEMHRKQ